jgi:hypothetical protein
VHFLIPFVRCSGARRGENAVYSRKVKIIFSKVAAIRPGLIAPNAGLGRYWRVGLPASHKLGYAPRQYFHSSIGKFHEPP